MKNSLGIILMLISVIGSTQSWQSIKVDAITYFSSDSTNIHCIRIDSTLVIGDTIVYKSFNMLRQKEDDFLCYSIYGDSWIGEKMQDLPNGMNVFFNKKHKPIYIKTTAQYGETWNLYNYSNSYYIEAKVTMVDTLNILGINDSIKVISFQLKDSIGTSIEFTNEYDSIYLINTSQLILSKSLGFYQIIDFYKFPVSTVYDIDYDMYGAGYIYKLIGVSNPLLGYQNLTASEIFDFNIDDEIHILDYSYSYTYSQTKQTIEKYISKIVSSNNDTITYTIAKCYFTSSYDNGVIDSVSGRDTIQFKFVLSDTQYAILNTLPMEPCENFSFWMFNSSDISYKYWSDFNSFYTNYYDSTCWSVVAVDPSYYRYYYKGLGGPFYNFTGYDNSENNRQIVYYKKGDIEVGTPYDCSILLKINNVGINNFAIYPNPVNELLSIITSQTKCEISIFDIYGKQILTTKLDNNESYHQINVSNLSKGIYLIKLTDTKNNIILSKKIIKN